MPQFILCQAIVALFIGLNIVLLSWLFPIDRNSKKKSKTKKV